MEGWEDQHGLALAKYEGEMKVWEAKMEQWQKDKAPKLREFEEKMKNWVEDNDKKTEDPKAY